MKNPHVHETSLMKIQKRGESNLILEFRFKNKLGLPKLICIRGDNVPSKKLK